MAAFDLQFAVHENINKTHNPCICPFDGMHMKVIYSIFSHYLKHIYEQPPKIFLNSFFFLATFC